MPPAIPRLKLRAEFLRVAAAGQKWAAPGLVLQARRRDGPAGSAPSRVGYTVSRKVGNAVKRNRARRRLRAAVHEVLPRHALEGFDFVVIGRTATVTRPFALLVEDLRRALGRVGADRQGAGS